jgi:hypothetical protein
VTGRSTRTLAFLLAAAALLVFGRAAAQERHITGQNVVPVFEGWERNADGSFNMVFGYMNRNYDEEVDVPTGADNRFEPGEPDRGQPTHFYNRRQQFMFKVRVPKDWGDKKDLVWTLTSHGRTERAYGSLWPVWEIDRNVYQQNRGGPGELGEPDEPPSIALVGSDQRTGTVGVPLTLTVKVTDDGRPTPRATRSGTNASGGGSAAGRIGPRPQNPIVQAVVRLDPGMRLGVIWVVHRRSLPAAVGFDPMKVAVTEGKATTRVTFSRPGVYVLRGYADDGILLSSADVTVTVTGS